MNQVARLQIQAMGHLHQLLTRQQIIHGLWGGWIPDIYQGKILRDHGDLDYLYIVNHSSDQDLQSLLQADGWKIVIDRHNALIGHQNQLEINFIAVQQTGKIITWDPPDRAGVITFPADWFQETEFQGVKISIIDIRFTYAMRYLAHQADQKKASAVRTLRPKDTQDLKILTEIIHRLAADDPQYLTENIFSQVRIPDSIFGLSPQNHQ